jgi:hypothetical protein
MKLIKWKMDFIETECHTVLKKRRYPKIFSKLFTCEKGEFGMSAIIGIAIGLIIAAFVLIPGIQTFAQSIMTQMQSWWTNTISSQIFPN